jgi:hypothetical protein
MARPAAQSREANAARLEKTLRLLHVPSRGTDRPNLITRRGVMERFGFPTVNAVRMFAVRHEITHVMLGNRALYDPSDWARALSPSLLQPARLRRRHDLRIAR